MSNDVRISVLSDTSVESAVSPDTEAALPRPTTKMRLEDSVAESLFLGQIVEENLFPFPKLSEAESETLRMVLSSIDRFLSGKERDFAEWDRKGEQPEEYIQLLRELGLFGVIVPEEHGGIGLSNTGYSRVLQQTSRYDASTSLTVGAHSSIGMKGLLLFGTPEQKQKYLSRLAAGEMIAAFCLTESGAGSDAASISTNAVREADGGWLLNGEKIWITNGPLADFFTVFARTDSEQGKISAFIVEKSYTGVSAGAKEDKLGIRASATSSVHFENVRVPAENLLGEEGKGFKVAMEILNNGRTGLGGGCVGGMKACLKWSAVQARDRKQFGKSISEFLLVKEKIAQMAVDCFATESAVAMVGHYIDSGVQDYSLEAAISKVFASEAMWKTANEALQIAGGNGYMKEFPYERIMRDSRINMIFEGTNEILRLYIALSGMKDTGKYLKNVVNSTEKIFNDPIKGFGVLSGYASKKFSQYTSLGRDRLFCVHERLRAEAMIFEKCTLELSRATEKILRRYGENVIGKQFEMKRLADAASDIFVGLCVLSRVSRMLEEEGEVNAAQPLLIAKIFSQQAKRRIRGNIRRLDSNEDSELKELADFIVENQGYPWDTI